MYQHSRLSSDWPKMTLFSVTYISQFSFPSRQKWGVEVWQEYCQYGMQHFLLLFFFPLSQFFKCLNVF